MSDNEVKIHVSADADLKGIEATQKRIDDLHKAAKAYEAKGMDTAAGSARSEAHGLERDVARFTRERRAAEQAVTREIREQQALRRAGIQRVAGVVSAGRDIATGGDAGGSAASTLLGAGVRSGNPAAIIATAIAAALIGVKGILDKEADKDKGQGLGVSERAFNKSYQLNRESGIFGSSSGLVSSALSEDEDIAKRKAARGGLDEKARQKWHDPSSWEWFGLRKNAGRRDSEVNEAEIQKAEQRKDLAIKTAQKKFMAEEGKLEMEILQGRSKRTMAGSREAFAAEMGQGWLADYKAVVKSSGSEKIAKEMADLAMQNKLRDRQASAGAGLVSPTSGGAEIAAAARWSTQVFPDVAARIEALHATVQSQSNPLRDQSKQ